MAIPALPRYNLVVNACRQVLWLLNKDGRLPLRVEFEELPNYNNAFGELALRLGFMLNIGPFLGDSWYYPPRRETVELIRRL
jgi:hypothetical protein